MYVLLSTGKWSCYNGVMWGVCPPEFKHVLLSFNDINVAGHNCCHLTMLQATLGGFSTCACLQMDRPVSVLTVTLNKHWMTWMLQATLGGFSTCACLQMDRRWGVLRRTKPSVCGNVSPWTRLRRRNWNQHRHHRRRQLLACARAFDEGRWQMDQVTVWNYFTNKTISWIKQQHIFVAHSFLWVNWPVCPS